MTLHESELRRNRLASIKTRFVRWFDETDSEPKLRSKLLRGVESMIAEIGKRSEWSEVVTIALDDSSHLGIRIRGSYFQVVPCAECLAVSTVVPGWGFGWGDVLKEEEVREILSWFMHYFRQYIHRSSVARALMLAWEADGSILHPFGAEMIYQRYGAVTPPSSRDQALDIAMKKALVSWGSPEIPKNSEPIASGWSLRNTLDPFHEAIFYFLRGQKLVKDGYNTEAIVAFDCVMQSIAKLLMDRRGLPVAQGRDWICRELGLNLDQGLLANRVYARRNEFGAHSGGWRWWDQDEFLDDEIMKDTSELVTATLRVAADAEPLMRTVEPDPVDWASWFIDNFDVLWDAIWFERAAKANL